MNRHIYIYSPSSAVRDRAAFRRGVRHLQSLGYEVEVDADALAQHQRFAGDDEQRVAAIGRAAASGAAVALISRGGYGITRILPAVPLKALHQAVARGTQFVGMSDFTALQCALLARHQTVTWAGPALGDGFGRASADGGVDDITQACFEDLLLGRAEGTGWRMGLREEGLWADALPKQTPAKQGQNAWQLPAGTLWGGNLSVLVSLLGTPWMPAIRRGVLFLEDVNEHPYRIERMLTQLLHAGVLAQQRAVVLGHFNRYRLVPRYDRGFDMPAVVQRLRSQLKVPVITQLPFGHVPTQVCLPVGRPVQMQGQGREVLMVWGHD